MKTVDAVSNLKMGLRDSHLLTETNLKVLLSIPLLELKRGNKTSLRKLDSIVRLTVLKGTTAVFLPMDRQDLEKHSQ